MFGYINNSSGTCRDWYGLKRGSAWLGPSGQASKWRIDQIQVTDGGEDGVGSTTTDNTLLLKQGIFAPLTDAPAFRASERTAQQTR